MVKNSPMVPQEAFLMLQDLSTMWNTPEPSLAFDCPDCFNNQHVLACYHALKVEVCLRSNLITSGLVVHEYGHHFYRSRKGVECPWYVVDCPTMAESEAFAQWFEHLYAETRFDFTCQICFNTYPWTLLGDGGVQCVHCHSIYDIK